MAYASRDSEGREDNDVLNFEDKPQLKEGFVFNSLEARKERGKKRKISSIETVKEVKKSWISWFKFQVRKSTDDTNLEDLDNLFQSTKETPSLKAAVSRTVF